DNAVPYNICGGAQDNGTWCGPSRRRVSQTTLGYWYTISGGDGFYAAMDPTDPNIVYGESQGGNVSRLNLKTGERYGFQKPSWQPKYKEWEDSIAVVRGDPLKPAAKAQLTAIAALRKLQARDSADLSLRYNWNSPFFISPHNAAVIYFAGNRVLKSSQRGADLQIISPDLSRQLTAKLDTALRLTGGITLDATGAETYGTVVALEESPAKPGLLYAGTDDGNVWRTTNDGGTWENIGKNIAGLPNAGEVYVTRIEASAFDPNVVYVAFDNHRNGDFKPYLFMSKDGGKSFSSIVNNLPADGNADFLHVVREDPNNADVLYVGSSLSVYASIDRGASWFKLAAGLPSVPVYDLQVHPRDKELIAATHGRGFWIVDVAPLSQMTKAVAAKPVHLFTPRTAFQWGEEPLRGASGNGNAQGFFATPNPAYGANISYRITQAGSPARISVLNAVGDTISTITGPGSVGLHTVTWNFGIAGPAPARAPLSPSEKRDSILRAVRMPQVLDSLTTAKYDSTALALAKQLLNPPAGGGNFRGGGGAVRAAAGPCERPLTQWDPFCARPAEATPRPGGAAAGGPNLAELQQRAQQLQNAASNPAVRKVFELIGLPLPAQGRGFGGFGGGGRTATTGDYGVVLQIGNTIQKTTLRIENMGGAGGANPFGFEDEGDRR
ncbi:MAG: WD40/YVTN/BNR-like repeat-containing protein, partial [Gemmatimonas sp.]